MSELDDGGRAFPWCGDLNETPTIGLGMTLRDYFAAKAMQSMMLGILARSSTAQTRDAPHISEASYALADNMLKERAK